MIQGNVSYSLAARPDLAGKSSIGDSSFFWWVVDVNGFKGPNKVGVDIFGIFVMRDKVAPLGTPNTHFYETTYCSKTNISSAYTAGLGCSLKALIGESY